MEASVYQKEASRTDKINWQHRNGADVAILGAIGEMGSLAAVIKKRQRDREAYAGFREDYIEELGDVLWYIAITSRKLGITFSRWPKPSEAATDMFSEIYKLFDSMYKFRDLKSVLLEQNQKCIEHEGLLLRILIQLQTMAMLIGTELSTIAKFSIDKTLSTWVYHEAPARIFDEDFPFYERLPRKFSVEVHSINSGTATLMMMNGMVLGDRLTDNSNEDDGYRYHDVFHLAGVATLGWSPVMRGLLKAKRKSHPKTDEVQDGARAAIVEEAIINHVYDYARPNFLKDVKTIDYELIKRIKKLVRGYEVEECESWEWQDCILKSYKVFRDIKEQGSGCLFIDADMRSITLQPLNQT